MTAGRQGPLRFFLGGRDLEMLEIRRLLDAEGARVTDKAPSWGAGLSAYREELVAAVAAGETPVVVELADDLAPDAIDRSQLLVVDHHGVLAGADRPTSIEQIFDLLHLPRQRWSRRLALIAANDRGHIAEMQALAASAAEIAAIRTEDRRAQGVSEADEQEARRAIAARTLLPGLTRVDTLSRTSTAVADLMHPALGGPGYVNLLVVMPGKLALFGIGSLIELLADRFPGSWKGGALPDRGFWGLAGSDEAVAIAAHAAQSLAASLDAGAAES